MKIGEETNVTLDLKTIGIIIGGVVAIATTYFTLSSSVAANTDDIENLKTDGVSSVEFQYKDELVRSTIQRIEEKQEVMSDDVKEVKDQLSKIDERLYQISKNK
jgi:gas vesicle protein|tara:strand:+ start:695 stop:1006 length:312 start_codon:yes stop_codon:yes gene_type:complete